MPRQTVTVSKAVQMAYEAAATALHARHGITGKKSEKLANAMVRTLSDAEMRQFGQTKKKARLAQKRLRRTGLVESPGPQAQARRRFREGLQRARKGGRA